MAKVFEYNQYFIFYNLWAWFIMLSDKVKGEILCLLRLNFSSTCIIAELKKQKISVSKRQINYLRNSIEKTEKTNVQKRKNDGNAKKLKRKDIAKLQRMVSSSNPPTQQHMASTLKVSQPAVHYHIHKTLQLKTYKKPKVHKLSEGNIEKRRTRSWSLYKLLKCENWKKIITTDEAWFHLSDCNKETEIQYVHPSEKNSTLQPFQRGEAHSQGIMAWAGVSFSGKTTLRFIKPGAKINSQYYIEEVLKPFLKNDALRLYPGNDYIFHQDSAPSHTSKVTREFMDQNMNYISPEQWTPKSPDLAPMDYFVWGWMKSQIKRRKPTTLEGLKKVVKQCWADLPQELINNALQAWPRRVRKVHEAKGTHIENNY